MAHFISGTLTVIFDEENRILMVQEGKEHVKGKWDFPGGGLEHDESIKECVEREVEEETGFKAKANGFYGTYIENSDTSELPVISFLISAEITGEGTEDHHFEGEILDHDFFKLSELKDLSLRKNNRKKMIKDIKNKKPVPIEILNDCRKNY